MPLRLGVEVCHDPAPGLAITAGGDDIGVFPQCLPEGHPSQSHTRRNDGYHRKPACPDGEARPGGNAVGSEQGEEKESEEAETVSKNRKGAETRGSEGESLEDDGIAESLQVGRDKLSSGYGLSGSCFTRERQDTAGGLVQRQEAALDRRLGLTSGGVTVARAARLVSSVICSASSRSSRC